MPTKHIDAAQWEQIEEITLELTKQRNQIVKESEVLKIIIDNGLSKTTKEEITAQLEYKPSCKVIMIYKMNGLNIVESFNKPTVMELINSTYRTPGNPCMIIIYGKTDSGRSTFIEKLKEQWNIITYDNLPDPERDIISHAKWNYDNGNSVAVVIYASSQMEAMNKIFPKEERILEVGEIFEHKVQHIEQQ